MMLPSCACWLFGVKEGRKIVSDMISRRQARACKRSRRDNGKCAGLIARRLRSTRSRSAFQVQVERRLKPFWLALRTFHSRHRLHI
jgi:hypothetical protein